MRAELKIADGSPPSGVKAGDEIALGIRFGKGGWGKVMVLLGDAHKQVQRCRAEKKIKRKPLCSIFISAAGCIQP